MTGGVPSMLYRILADGIVVVHFGFLLLVVFGGLLVLRWRRAAGLHIPAAIWGVLIELVGWPCPLTPLEQQLRRWAGQTGYEGSFIEHYIVPLIYPPGLTRTHQILLGLAVLVINAAVYAWLWRRSQRRDAQGTGRPGA